MAFSRHTLAWCAPLEQEADDAPAAKSIAANFLPLQSLAQKTPGSLLVHTQALRLKLELPYQVHMPPDEHETFKLTTEDDRDIAWLLPKSANWNLIQDAYD